jgi:hypothetical protein
MFAWCSLVQSRRYDKLGVGLALLLWVLADFRPVLFSNIVIYFHNERALSIETVQSITTRT